MKNLMKKNSTVSAIIALSLICFANLTVSAQTNPEQIKVKSLRIENYANLESSATITYLNSAQTVSSFSGWTSYGLSFMNSSTVFPVTLNSNGFESYGLISSAPGGNGDFRIRFYLTSADSAPIVLRPTILRKRREINVSGTADIRGRVEVIDQRTIPSRIIAVDSDIRLTGNYTAEFQQSRGGTRRTVIYSSIVYDLTQNL